MFKQVVRALPVVFLLLGSNQLSADVWIPGPPDDVTSCEAGFARGDAGYWVLRDDDDVVALRDAPDPWSRKSDGGSYQGTLECLVITGNVTDLSPLADRQVPIAFPSSLFVYNTNNLQNLAGLETFSESTLVYIYDNNALTDISGLRNMVAVNMAAGIIPGELCKDFRLPFMLHSDVDTIADNEALAVLRGEKSPPADLAKSVKFGPSMLNYVNESCLANAAMTDAEIENAIDAAFDGIYPIQQAPVNVIFDKREDFPIGQGSLRVFGADINQDCKFEYINLVDSDSATLGVLAEIDFLIGPDCVSPRNTNWIQDPLIIFDFGEDLPVGTRAGKTKNSEIEYLKRAKVVGPYLIYQLFDNVANEGSYIDGDGVEHQLTGTRGIGNGVLCDWSGCVNAGTSGWVWRRGCTDQIMYGSDYDVNYLNACTENDDLDEDPRHGYIKDPLLLIIPTPASQQQQVPALPLFGLLALSGLLGLFGLRKLRK